MSKGGENVRTKKAVWLVAMVVIAATLVFVIGSRINLTSEVILGGADSVFVDSDNLSKPLDKYNDKANKSDKYEGVSFPSIEISEWYYILINDSNPRKEYAPVVQEVRDTGVYFDIRAVDYLVDLLDAAKKEGFEPYISCGYVSYAAQQQAFNEEASKLEANGKYSYEEAAKLAEGIIARAGASDHQTALAVHITDKQYDKLDYSKMDKEFYAWLDEHCAEYGFIKRFPSTKANITGWDEPWHYRFVGVPAAEFIAEYGMSFEEFTEHYDYQK